MTTDKAEQIVKQFAPDAEAGTAPMGWFVFSQARLQVFAIGCRTVTQAWKKAAANVNARVKHAKPKS